MKQNGEAIYGTTASPFATQLSFGRATSKAGRVYLHVFDWPKDGRLLVPLVRATVKRVYLLASPKERLQFITDQKGITLQLPANAPDPIASVVVIETSK
jgi:alpha-L-fucosidase